MCFSSCWMNSKTLCVLSVCFPKVFSHCIKTVKSPNMAYNQIEWNNVFNICGYIVYTKKRPMVCQLGLVAIISHSQVVVENSRNVSRKSLFISWKAFIFLLMQLCLWFQVFESCMNLLYVFYKSVFIEKACSFLSYNDLSNLYLAWASSPVSRNCQINLCYIFLYKLVKPGTCRKLFVHHGQ